MSRQDGFQPVRQLPAGQQHSPAALQAFQADIGAQAGNPPIIASAGVSFTQPDDVAQVKVRQHE